MPAFRCLHPLQANACFPLQVTIWLIPCAYDDDDDNDDDDVDDYDDYDGHDHNQDDDDDDDDDDGGSDDYG